MKLEDINFSNKTNYKFRTVYRITLQVKGERSLNVGFNKEETALEVLAFLEDLVKTDPKYINVEMVHKPRVKGNISFSEAKKRRRGVYGVNGACPDLVKLFDAFLSNR